MRSGFVLPADPQTLIVPQAAATFQDGGRLQTAPFNVPSRFQQIFDKSEFVGLDTSLRITELAFRPFEDQATQGQKIDRIQLRLSTFKSTLPAFSPVFDRNVGRDELVVFDGPLTLRTRMRRGRGNTLQCDMAVPLSRPFHYNPAEGNLLLDIRNYSGPNTRFFVNSYLAPTIRMIYADVEPGRVTMGILQETGMVVQFKFVPTTKVNP